MRRGIWPWWRMHLTLFPSSRQYFRYFDFALFTARLSIYYIFTRCRRESLIFCASSPPSDWMIRKADAQIMVLRKAIRCRRLYSACEKHSCADASTTPAIRQCRLRLKRMNSSFLIIRRYGLSLTRSSRRFITRRSPFEHWETFIN